MSIDDDFTPNPDAPAAADLPEAEPTSDSPLEPDDLAALPDDVVRGLFEKTGYSSPADIADDPDVKAIAEGDETATSTDQPEETPESDAPETPAEEEKFVTPPGGPLTVEPEPDPGGGNQGLPGVAPFPAVDPSQGTVLPDGRTVTPQQLQQWAALDARLASDATLRENVSRLLNPAVPTSQVQGLPQAPQVQLPQLTEEDLQDPAVRALYSVAINQQQQMAQLANNQREQERVALIRQDQENRVVIEGAVSGFQAHYNIPSEVMARVRANSNRTAAVQTYMAGTDPRTGQPVTPDAHQAVTAALEMAYWNTPEARTFEFERQAERSTAAKARKAKLSGVGGSSASASRAPKPPDTSSEAGRYSAAVSMVARDMGLSED